MSSKNNIALYQQIVSAWENTGAWSDYLLAMRQALPDEKKRADPNQDPVQWSLLPGLCCQAAGGDPAWADEIGAAWFLFFIAAHVFDNVEDHDQPEEWWAARGAGVALNAASGLLFTASILLNQIHSKKETQLAAPQVCADFYRSILVMSGGQHRDLVAEKPGLEEWLAIAEAKSGAFFSLACRSGARLAIDEQARLEGFGLFGQSLGVLIQILDDLQDFTILTEEPAFVLPEKIALSLPVAYARAVFPESRLQAFENDLRMAIHSPEVAREVFHQIEESGAILFLRTEVERYHARAHAGLKAAAPGRKAGEILLSYLQKLRL